MPRYKVLERSHINHMIVEPGQEVEYDGLPGANLEPLDDAGNAKAAEYKAALEKHRVELAKQFPSTVGEAEAFSKALAEMRKDMAAQQAAMPEAIANAVAQALAQAFPNGMHKPAVAPEGDTAKT